MTRLLQNYGVLISEYVAINFHQVMMQKLWSVYDELYMKYIKTLSVGPITFKSYDK